LQLLPVHESLYAAQPHSKQKCAIVRLITIFSTRQSTSQTLGGAAKADVNPLLRGGGAKDNEDSSSSGVKVAGCAMPLTLEVSKQQRKADLSLGISVRTTLGDSVRLFIYLFI
jgi:hypothetical protein